jgi:hypothetical protein
MVHFGSARPGCYGSQYWVNIGIEIVGVTLQGGRSSMMS